VSTEWSDAPPTDTELHQRGLGIRIEPPHIAIPELELADQLYKLGLSPRRIQPPSEVTVALDMYRAEQKSNSSSPVPPSFHERHSASPTKSLKIIPPSRTASDIPPSSSPNNAYSLGGSLPKGATWRYVDVLNNK
jgi:hypothetical protein